jgi:dephospho-CoA kinase
VKIVALIGETGTGKSTIAAHLAAGGAAVIDADALGHELLDTDPVVRGNIRRLFGPGVFRPAGAVDRAKLGAIVFGNKKALSGLNDILHPAIIEAAGRRIAELRRANTRLVVIDAALLLEVETPLPIDCVVALRCDREEQVRRLLKAGIPEQTIRDRLRNQADLEKSFHKADVIVDTGRAMEDLFAEIDAIIADVLGESP